MQHGLYGLVSVLERTMHLELLARLDGMQQQLRRRRQRQPELRRMQHALRREPGLRQPHLRRVGSTRADACDVRERWTANSGTDAGTKLVRRQQARSMP